MGYLQELLSQEYFDLVNEGDRLFELGNLVEAKNRFERARELFDRLVGQEAARRHGAQDPRGAHRRERQGR